MPASTTDLVRRDGVELIRTGSWQIASGSWNPTPQDIAAAVAAQNCPAVRRPVIKLGHTDARFTPGDGEPALGWFENLRASDGGHTLVADQVTLPWLDKVQAAAYPDRSVEGLYGFRCQVGHTHPFVLTAVALLGVTPPGVGTLRSLNDVKDLFTVTAADGARPVSLTVHAGRHSFDEGKHDRDNDGQFATTPGGDKDLDKGRGGGTSSGGKAPAADHLKLSGRIKLGAGESLVGSDSLAADDGSVIPVALTRSGDSTNLRIATGILAEDKGRWSGADKGNTVVLNEDGIAHLVDALDGMVDAAQEGAQRRKGLESERDDLSQQQRTLIRAQHPDLNKAQGRELDQIDVRVPQAEERVAALEAQQSDANAQLSDGSRRRWLDLEAQASALLEHPLDASGRQRLAQIRAEQANLHNERETDGQRVGYASLARRRQEQLDGLRESLERDRARRAELTANGRELSDAEAAQLRQVTADLERVEGEIAVLVDDGELLAGTIPAEWGTLSYRAAMTESGPDLRLAVRRAGNDGADTDTRLTAAQARRFISMLVSLGGSVAATSDGVRVPNLLIPVAAATDEKLRKYWLAGAGAAKIRWGTPGDFTRCVRNLREHVRDPEGLCAEYHKAATGMWPGDKRNTGKVAASMEDSMLTPDAVRAAWNTSAPMGQWIVEIAPDLSHVVVVDDDNHRQFARVPVLAGADGAVTFGQPMAVRPGYVEQAVAASAAPVVFASRDESRPPDPAVEPPSSDPTHLPSTPAQTPTTPPEVPAPTLPAAEPEPTTEPKEDPVSLSDEMRSRLGLADDADEAAALAAIDALKTKAETPAQPDPQLVSAAAAARDEMKTEIERLSGELASIKASAAADSKKSLFDSAVSAGKLKPADREGWEARYDRAPEVITEILASIAPNTAVPVAAAGHTGSPDVDVTDEALMKAFFPPSDVARFEKTEA